MLHSCPALSAHSPAAPAAQPSAHCGSFALHAGRAMTLQPRAAAQLRITEGAAWVTLDSLPGDHFLCAGDVLSVQPGDKVVMQPHLAPQHLYFDWDPVAMAAPTAQGIVLRGSWLRQAVARPTRVGYCAAVLEPLADLRAALGLAAGAAARLAKGVLGLAVGWLGDKAVFWAASRARSSTV
jgi:Protein of unknown function (DUF2917)